MLLFNKATGFKGEVPSKGKPGKGKKEFAYRVVRNEGKWFLVQVHFKLDASKKSTFKHERPFGDSAGYTTEANAEKALRMLMDLGSVDDGDDEP